MADDTRQREDLSKEALTLHPENKPFSGAQWDGAKSRTYKPPENANMLAGGTENTAGGKIPEVSISNAFEGELKLSDFTELPKKPCVRDSFMTGIGAGFAAGGLRTIFGATIMGACNWAVFSALGGAAIAHEYCRYKRQAEKDGMMRAVEILNKNQIEKKAREAQKEREKESRRRQKEQELETQYTALREGKDAKSDDGGIRKPWWKVW